jgi:tRNA pseudouridine55 synthase
MATEDEGILVVKKGPGLTSHDIVARLRRIFNMRRVGHCGTLDPLATGVLVVCLGRLTRLNEWIANADKEYLATFYLGANSDTGDANGVIQPTDAYEPPDFERLESSLQALTGTYDQVPPAFSAIKVNGVPSYRLARQNKAVPLKARKITIKVIEPLQYSWPMLRIRVACSKGTYIRSLAMDLGTDLGCGAYVNALHRTRVGTLDETNAWTLEEIETRVNEARFEGLFVPPVQCLDNLPHLVLNSLDLKRFGSGQGVSIASFDVVKKRQNYAIFDINKCLYGIGCWDLDSALMKPVKVFHPA